MTAAGYDVKKLPLGNLDDETVTAGFNCLSKLRNVFKNISNKKTTLDKEMPDVKKLSSEFYTLIPHNFGF